MAFIIIIISFYIQKVTEYFINGAKTDILVKNWGAGARRARWARGRGGRGGAGGARARGRGGRGTGGYEINISQW